MLKILRKKGVAKKILWVVAGVIVISFVFFGAAGTTVQKTNPLDHAGKIFGKEISFNQFQDAYEHTRNQAILRYGENFDKISQYLNLENETWDRLILLHEAEKRKIKIKNEELIETIEKYPFFQRNGQFDNLLYNEILRYVFKSKPRDFEEGIRETLNFSKLFSQETANVTISDDETWNAYKKQKEKVQVSYILIETEKYKSDATFDEKKAKEFFEENKTTFIVPLMVNVEFINLNQSETASSEEKTQNESKINSAYDEIKNGTDFTAAALKFGFESGETGLFSQQEPNLKIGWAYNLLKAAFELGVGEMSSPIETPQGFSIIRVKEKRPEHQAEFSEVQDKIKEAMLLQAVKEIARQKAQELVKKAQDSTVNNLTALTNKDPNLKIQQTPFFSHGEYLPSIGISKEFQEAAFNLKEEKKLSDVVEIPSGFCILSLDSFQAAKQEDFDKEKEEFKKALLDEKRNEKFNDFLANLRIRANLQDNISKLKEKESTQN